MSFSAEKVTKDLKNKTVIISGGTGSMGKKIVYKLAKKGANVVLLTHNMKIAEEVIKEIKRLGGDGMYLETNVSKDVEAKGMIEKVVAKYGSVDIAINASGYGPNIKDYPSGNIQNLTEENFDTYIDNGLKGLFLSMKYELEQMNKQKSGGIIINFAVQGLETTVNNSLYSIVKRSTVSLTETAALESQTNNKKIYSVVLVDKIVGTDEEKEKIEDKIADAVGVVVSNPVNYNGKTILVNDILK